MLLNVYILISIYIPISRTTLSSIKIASTYSLGRYNMILSWFIKPCYTLHGDIIAFCCTRRKNDFFFIGTYQICHLLWIEIYEKNHSKYSKGNFIFMLIKICLCTNFTSMFYRSFRFPSIHVGSRMRISIIRSKI